MKSWVSYLRLNDDFCYSDVDVCRRNSLVLVDVTSRASIRDIEHEEAGGPQPPGGLGNPLLFDLYVCGGRMDIGDICERELLV